MSKRAFGKSPRGADQIKKRLGKRIRDLREDRDLRQEDLAPLAGVNSVTLSKIETGRRLPDLSTLYGIAEGLKVLPAALLDDGVALQPRPPTEANGGKPLRLPAAPLFGATAHLLTAIGHALLEEAKRQEKNARRSDPDFGGIEATGTDER